MIHYGMCRFRLYYWKYSLHCLRIRSPNLFSVMKLVHNRFFYIELKISSVALVLPLTMLLSHLLQVPLFLLMWLSYFINPSHLTPCTYLFFKSLMHQVVLCQVLL